MVETEQDRNWCDNLISAIEEDLSNKFDETVLYYPTGGQGLFFINVLCISETCSLHGSKLLENKSDLNFENVRKSVVSLTQEALENLQDTGKMPSQLKEAGDTILYTIIQITTVGSLEHLFFSRRITHLKSF